MLPTHSSSLLSPISSHTPTSSTQLCFQSTGTALQTDLLSAWPTASWLPSGLSSDLTSPKSATTTPISTTWWWHPGIFNYLSTQGSAVTIHQQTTYYLDLVESTTTSLETATAGNPVTIGPATYSSVTVPSTTFPTLNEAGSLPTVNASPSRLTIDAILVVDNSGQTLSYNPAAPPAGATNPSALIALVDGKTLTENLAPILIVIEGETYRALPTPILTVINSETFTEIAAAVSTASYPIPSEYVDPVT